MASQHSPQRHPTTIAVRAALALLIAVSWNTAITPQTAVAAESAAASQRQYQIPAGPLNAALSSFAIEAGVSVATASAQVNGLHSKGLQGRYTVYEGFQKLLDGTGLEVVEEGSSNYSLRKAGAEPAMATMPASPSARKQTTTALKAPAPTPRAP